MKIVILFMSLCSFLSYNFVDSSSKLDIKQDIITAFRNGNAQILSNFFNKNIELVILDKEDIYSKAQAQLILQDFFSKHKPLKFDILHKGGKENSKYSIGKLKTKQGNFRVYFLIKNKKIYQLRIEDKS